MSEERKQPPAYRSQIAIELLTAIINETPGVGEKFAALLALENLKCRLMELGVL